MATERQLDVLVQVMRSGRAEEIRGWRRGRQPLRTLRESGLVEWDPVDGEWVVTSAGILLLDDVLVRMAVVGHSELHVLAASQWGTTQAALCEYVPEQGREWEFPTAAEYPSVRLVCEECERKRGGKPVR